MSMVSSLQKSILVGTLKRHFQGLTIVQKTRAGIHVINPDSQEKEFWPFPNETIHLLSSRQFCLSKGADVKAKYVLVLEQDLKNNEIFEEIVKIFTE